MEEPFNICLTCLSTDRSLVPLHKVATLLQEILFEELRQSLGGVCWECWSILKKFYKFKKKAKKAQDILLKTKKHRNIKPLSSLTSKTNIFYDYQYTYSLDPLTNCNATLKTEPDTIKQEIDEYLENNSVIDEKKSEIDEETENIYDDIEEIKYDSILLRKEDILDQCDCAIHNVSHLNDKSTDFDRKISDIHEKIENVYVNETKQRFAKQKCTKCVNGTKINFAEVIFSEHNEKFSEEMTEKVFVKTIEKKTNKHSMKKKPKRDLESGGREFQEKFTQVVLSEEEMLKAREEKRNHYNFKKIPYKCDSCVLGFTRKDTYSLHMRKKHDESLGDQTCDVCHIRFRHKLALNNHRSKHFVVYRCRLCKYEAHEYVWMVNHCKTKHEDDEPDKIHCSQCDIVVKTPEDLETHMQTEHTLFCDCGVKFKDKNNLRQHMSRAHSMLRSFICDICKKTFKTKTRLETHMASHSNMAKKLAYCQQCNIQYKNIRVYRGHLLSSSHHSQGYPCSECNKKFRSKGYLRQHYNFYHLRKSQYKCEVCNKLGAGDASRSVYVGVEKVNDRTVLVSGAISSPQHSWEKARQMMTQDFWLFISNWRLRNHKQQYHGLSRPRDHCCNTCGKKFFTSATLRSHQLTHSAQRSFMCAHCGDTFKQSAALYTHTRLRHRDGGTTKNNI